MKYVCRLQYFEFIFGCRLHWADRAMRTKVSCSMYRVGLVMNNRNDVSTCSNQVLCNVTKLVCMKLRDDAHYYNVGSS